MKDIKETKDIKDIVDTAKNNKAHLFQKGQSGNPAGRKKGFKRTAQVIAQNMMIDEAQALTHYAISQALRGDMQALKLCIERIIPVCKEMPITIKLPVVQDSNEIAKLTGAVLKEVSSGNLTSGQADILIKAIDAHKTAIELCKIESRIKALEELQQQKEAL